MLNHSDVLMIAEVIPQQIPLPIFTMFNAVPVQRSQALGVAKSSILWIIWSSRVLILRWPRAVVTVVFPLSPPPAAVRWSRAVVTVVSPRLPPSSRERVSSRSQADVKEPWMYHIESGNERTDYTVLPKKSRM
ncbi:unnamed protein product [Meganyctiphanes norvegica]|uniref:Uncharacterized protein n=1 Tax=Meganyctiphanes norvegica TaxID=48144 RepID=A0AAV2PII1_MEGNR